jgi:hypothetical protein
MNLRWVEDWSFAPALIKLTALDNYTLYNHALGGLGKHGATGQASGRGCKHPLVPGVRCGQPRAQLTILPLIYLQILNPKP